MRVAGIFGTSFSLFEVIPVSGRIDSGGPTVSYEALSAGSSAKNRPWIQTGKILRSGPQWGDVHVLQLDPFFTVEYYAFHAAYLIILLCWLYRHVKREIRRRDE